MDYSFIRQKVDEEEYLENDLEFQALEWFQKDEEDESEYSEEYDITLERYVVKVLGCDPEGNSICLNVKNFTPFFYVKLDRQEEVLKKTLVRVLGDLFLKSGSDYQKVFNFIEEKECIFCKYKDIYGFKGEESFSFLRLTFNNVSAMKRAMWAIDKHNKVLQSEKNLLEVKQEISDKEGEELEKLKKTKEELEDFIVNNKKLKEIDFLLPLYETKLEPFIRLLHIKNLRPTGWIKVSKENLEIVEDKKSNCSLEFSCDWTCLEYLEKKKVAPFLQASFDIETLNEDNSFDPTKKDNVCFQIATTFKRFGEDKVIYKSLLCLGPCSSIEGVNVECFETEKQLLVAWKDLILSTDPDILYQYNGDQFDGNYIYERSVLNSCEKKVMSLTRLKEEKAFIKEAIFESSAYGTNKYKRLVIPGRVNFDILIYIKREYKEISYKLDSIAEKYLGENKHDVNAFTMFKHYKSKDPDKVKIVGEYCVQDTLLPQKLVDKLHIFTSQISMSNVCFVPIKYLIERGQMIKVYSQLVKSANKKGFLVPTLDYNRDEEDNSFVGATVLEPEVKAHFFPITTLDFASLYPSIMRAHNFCFSTIVLDKKYLGLENIDYFSVECQGETYYFNQSSQGILPALLEELGNSRKHYKKLMNEEKDPFLKEIHNRSQLAVKVSMNSMYGFLAAPMLKCKPIAACITSVGRQMIEQTKDYLENNFKGSKSRVVYGDSVVEDTPILLKCRKTGLITFKYIKDLVKEKDFYPYEEFKSHETNSNRVDKQQGVLRNFYVYSDIGWTPVKRVIRHRTDKKIFSVGTDKGYIETTEDHSLCNTSGEKIKPEECIVNETKLLHSGEIKLEPFFREAVKELKVYEIEIICIFLAKGYIQENEYLHESRRYSVSFRELSLSERKKIIKCFQEGEIEEEHHGSLINLELYSEKYYNHFRDLFYPFEEDERVLPSVILNGSSFVKNVFYDIIFKDKQYKSFSKLLTSGIYILSKSIGKELIITPEICSFVLTEKNKDYFFDSKVKEIYLSRHTSKEEYVYDIETVSGKFMGGIGELILFNTDSCFVMFNTPSKKDYKKALKEKKDKEITDVLRKKCILESIELGKKAAEEITEKVFKTPIKLEYEKIFCPLFLFSKKRYIGKLYTEDAENYIVKNSGIVLTRRDNTPLLKKTYKKMIDYLIEGDEIGIDKSLEYLDKVLDDIIYNQVDIDELVVSKSLRTGYKNTNTPHVYLSNKMKGVYKTNDRVPYVFIDPVYIAESKNGKRKIPQYLKVEDPEKVREKGLTLDREYYINSMKNPISELLSLFITYPEKIFFDKIIELKEN